MIQVRFLNDGDRLAVAELLRPQYQDGSLGYQRWTNWVMWSYYVAYHNPDDEMSFVAVDEMGNVVGAAVAFNDELPPGEDDELPPEGWEDAVPPEDQQGRYYVETATVRGDVRGQGIATMLMGAIEAEAMTRGLWPIVTMVPPDSPAAEALRRHGYREGGHWAYFYKDAPSSD